MSSGVAQHAHTPASCINLLLPLKLTSPSDTAPNRSILADGLNFLLLVAEDVELFYQRPRGYDLKVSAERLEVARAAMIELLKQIETADNFSEQALQDFTLANLLDVLEPQWPQRILGPGRQPSAHRQVLP